MPFPYFIRKLFQNDGAGEHLRTDIGALSYDAQTLTAAQKQQVLANLAGTFLRLTGGKITGTLIVSNALNIGKYTGSFKLAANVSSPISGFIDPVYRDDARYVCFYSKNASGTGNSGGRLYAYGSDDPANAGNVELFAHDDVTANKYSRLVLKPDGSVTINSKYVDSVDSRGDNYVRYSTGLQICFGSLKFTGGWNTYFTLPVPFKDTNYAVTAMGEDRALLGTEPVETSRFTAAASNPSGANLTFNGNYLAVGFWR